MSPSSESRALPLRTSLLLYSSLLIMGMSHTVVFAILPMLGRELELDKLVINLPALDIYFEPRELAITALAACTSLAIFVGAPFWGRLSDKRGRKLIIITGLIGYALGSYLFNGVAHLGLNGILAGFTLYVIFVATRTALVFVMSAIVPSVTAYMVDVAPPAQRTAYLSKLTAATQIGTLSGPALVAFVSFGFLVPLYVHATVTLLVAIAIWRWLPVSRKRLKDVSSISRLSFFDPRYRHFLLIGVVAFTVQGMVQMSLGFYFEDQFGLSRVDATMKLSLALVVCSVAMLLAQFLVVVRWKDVPIGLVKWGAPMVSLGCVIIAASGSVIILMVGMLLFGFGMGMVVPGFTVSATYTVTPEDQGALAGLSSSATALGVVFGPLLSGYLYHFSTSLNFWLAAVSLALLWLFSLSIRMPEKSWIQPSVTASVE